MPVYSAIKLPALSPGNGILREVSDILTAPGVRLVMPAEETEDFIGGLQYSAQADRLLGFGGSSGPTHETGMRSYARVFANEIAEPYMISEKLRFPVGSMIVREKLRDERTHDADLVAAMIKRERGFDRASNDWEFVVIDKGFTRVKRGDDTQRSCLSCHASARDSDLVYKSYLGQK